MRERSCFEKLNTTKWASLALFAAVFLLLLFCNRHTALVADDFRYCFSFADGSRMTALSQLLPSMAAHRHSMNGRVIAHALVQLFLLPPKPIFDAVNANFSEVFSMLFPGGQAHLEMTDPDHLSETGIEVVAQPRGKRIQKMTLMSGGEKSLTALALLFAVYKTRTVPFYVFDEVEAALDDSNLSKLLDAIEQLKDTTQLIVISHQRRTMEQADVLYGVSMQADGVSHVVSQRLDRATGKVVEA